MRLKKVDCITISTRFGNSQIELLIGDITTLTIEDKVDVVMTSAFRGDYSAFAGTLLGALSCNLGVSVQKLSEDKEVDLRKHFSCWVSKPLPDNIPFSRLVCFERNRNSEAGSIEEQISSVFRAMMPIFNNHDTTVITPLLATGMQGHSPPAILKAMVEGACHWIEAGLPLKCLKLVLFTKSNKICCKDQQAVEVFKNLKLKWKSITRKESIMTLRRNDVFISYRDGDETFVNQISSSFKCLNSGLTIFSRQISYHKESVWQESIFSEMTKSKRIIVVLTPSYIESVECLEQFNMALCCNRQQGKDILFPFYVQTVASLPAYMQLVQYVDCRERKVGDVTMIKIKNACNSILTHHNDSPPRTPNSVSESQKSQPEDLPSSKQTYDVFLSYSHKHEQTAKMFIQHLEEKDSKLNVFFDRTDLKMGSSWQHTLYEGICSSKCIVALVSKSYFESTVCCEEYNLAVARFLAHDSMYFLPVCIAETESVQPEYGQIKMVDCRTDTEVKLEQIADKVIKLARHGTTDSLFSQASLTLTPYQVMAENRKQMFEAEYSINNGTVCRKTELEKEVNSNVVKCDIVMSFSFQSIKFAAVFSYKMAALLPGANCIFLSEHRSQRLQLLDSAKYIVIFVSDHYAQSPQQMEELHLALCRQRAGGNKKFVYLVQCQKSVVNPFYLQLLPYSVCLDDTEWKKTAISLVKESYSAQHTVKMTRATIQGSYTCTLSEYLALTTVCLDIQKNFYSSHCTDNKASIVSVLKMDLKNNNLGLDNVPISECFQDKPLTITKKSTVEEEKTDEIWNKVLDDDSSVPPNTKHTTHTSWNVQSCNDDTYGDRLSQLSFECHDSFHDTNIKMAYRLSAKKSAACCMIL